MNQVHLSDDEIKQLALPLLNQPGLGHGLTERDLLVSGPELEGDPDIWRLEVLHPAGAKLDVDLSISAGSSFTQSVFRNGDSRLFVLQHRFGAPFRSAA